ncbi:hypothetical protein B8W69_08205 [Mycobacterium vulneris]|jgi:hypothetical membrane protein|uniref:DUF998 domain-containing protein n=1 Tax=Mycolicibacterium vulneris TaxID=547163 RepID=A0A1X2L8D4_9MYCO|nr:DUF998 domain-containing protein [Mycolicibacterium vulneris]OSC30269.1 hypothetical protein B8W69_08205 [Mycolicibacterium vulneris]
MATKMERHNSAGARGAALWVVAAVGYLVLEAIAAAAYEPAYSYARNYISDLGLPNGTLAHGHPIYSPRAYLMHAAFYLQGILFLLGASLMVGVPDNRRTRMFLGSVATNAVGNIVIGSVHSGTVHIIGALLALVGGNAAILLGSGVIGPLAAWRRYRRISKAIAALGLFCLAMLMMKSVTATTYLLPDGAWERGSVYTITGWQLLTAACLLARTTRVSARSRSPRHPRPRR